jgi:hypothetical protein
MDAVRSNPDKIIPLALFVPHDEEDHRDLRFALRRAANRLAEDGWIKTWEANVQVPWAGTAAKRWVLCVSSRSVDEFTDDHWKWIDDKMFRLNNPEGARLLDRIIEMDEAMERKDQQEGSE